MEHEDPEPPLTNKEIEEILSDLGPQAIAQAKSDPSFIESLDKEKSDTSEDRIAELVADYEKIRQEIVDAKEDIKDTKNMTVFGFYVLLFVVVGMLATAAYNKEQSYLKLIEKVNELSSQREGEHIEALPQSTYGKLPSSSN